MELENVPSWLEVPLKYYKTLGKDLRLELYQLISKGNVEDKIYKLISTLLQLLQLSTVMLDDMSREVETRGGVKAIHLEHTPRDVGLWALGLSHYIYKLIAENIGPDELAFKYIQLYNDLGTRVMTGDPSKAKDYESLQEQWEEEKKSTDRNHRELLKRNIACYVASFPVALYALEKTEDAQKALRLLEDDALLEFGFLLQSEVEFVDFHTESNKDIERQNWPVLIDLLAKAMGDKFEYPKSKEETITLLEKYNIYDEYLKKREAGLQSLKYELMSMKMSQLKGGGSADIFEAKLRVLEYCLEYFEIMKYNNEGGGSQKALTKEEAIAAQKKGNGNENGWSNGLDDCDQK